MGGQVMSNSKKAKKVKDNKYYLKVCSICGCLDYCLLGFLDQKFKCLSHAGH